MSESVPFYLSYAGLWALVIFQTVVILGMARSLHRLQTGGVVEEPAHSLEGKPAPAFSMKSLTGEVIGTDTFDGRQTALLFVSPDCSTCGVTLAEMDAIHAKTHGNVVVVCRSTEARCAQVIETYRLKVPLIVDEDLELSRLYHVAAAPTAVLIDAQGRIESYGQPMNPDDFALAISTRSSNGSAPEMADAAV